MPGYPSINQTQQLLDICKYLLYEKVHRGTIPLRVRDRSHRPIRLPAWLREKEVGAERFQLPKTCVRIREELMPEPPCWGNGRFRAPLPPLEDSFDSNLEHSSLGNGVNPVKSRGEGDGQSGAIMPT